MPRTTRRSISNNLEPKLNEEAEDVVPKEEAPAPRRGLRQRKTVQIVEPEQEDEESNVNVEDEDREEDNVDDLDDNGEDPGDAKIGEDEDDAEEEEIAEQSEKDCEQQDEETAKGENEGAERIDVKNEEEDDGPPKNPNADDYANAFALYYREHLRSLVAREPALTSKIADLTNTKKPSEKKSALPSRKKNLKKHLIVNDHAKECAQALAENSVLDTLEKYLTGESEELNLERRSFKRRKVDSVGPVVVPSGVDDGALKRIGKQYNVKCLSELTTVSGEGDVGNWNNGTAAESMLRHNAQLICELQLRQLRRNGKPADIAEKTLAGHLRQSLVSASMSVSIKKQSPTEEITQQQPLLDKA